MRERNFTEGPWHPGPMHKTIRPKALGNRLNGGFVICDRLFGPDAVANARLMAEAPALFDMLEQLAEQHKCGCGHPHCNRCEDYRLASDILDRAAGA